MTVIPIASEAEESAIRLPHLNSVRLFAFLLALSLSLAAAAQQPNPQAEQEMLRLLNLARARAGLTSLKLDPKLQQAARDHSQKMAEQHKLSHELGNEPGFARRLENAGAQFSNAGENVAFNQSAGAAHESLMHSPPHRANILSSKFNSVGIGVVQQGENLWVTQDFAREYEKLTDQQARDRVFAALQQARKDAKLSSLKLVTEPRLQTIACRMAHDGRLATRDVLALPGVHNAVAYTDTDLASLPSSARKLAGNSSITRVAVAACFASSAKYPSGMYWGVIAAY